MLPHHSSRTWICRVLSFRSDIAAATKELVRPSGTSENRNRDLFPWWNLLQRVWERLKSPVYSQGTFIYLSDCCSLHNDIAMHDKLNYPYSFAVHFLSTRCCWISHDEALICCPKRVLRYRPFTSGSSAILPAERLRKVQMRCDVRPDVSCMSH